MGNALITAVLKNKGEQECRAFVSRLMVDVEGHKFIFPEFIKTATRGQYWVIFWNEDGREKYGRKSSLFCFYEYVELTVCLVGKLAESERSVGDCDEFCLVYIEKIKVVTLDDCFSFIEVLYKENKDLNTRFAIMKRRIQYLLE